MIRLTELTSSQGTIAKKYSISEQGEVSVNSAATIYSATARPIELAVEDVADYLNSLASDPTRCIISGICGDTGAEFNLVTQENVKDGSIARTREFFKYANGGAVSLLHLDFDGNHTEKQRQQFLSDLDTILEDALIGERGSDRKKICKWHRPSTSSSVSIKGKAGNGLHVFIPVKKCNDELLKLIHRFCWLTNKGYKLTSAGTLLSESLIDPSTGSPERVIYTSDAEVEGPEEMWRRVDRTCSYTPGGIVDCELACDILREVTAEYTQEWQAYKQLVSNSEEVKQARQAWKDKQTQKLIDKGVSPKEAKQRVIALSELTLLSSDVLTRTTGEKVKVSDILLDPDSYIGMDKFNDPIKQESNRNVGKILGTESAPFLHSFNHGGVKYKLQWTYADLLNWVETCEEDELEDWYVTHLLNSSVTGIQEGKLNKIVAKRLKVSVTNITKDLKEQEEAKEDRSTAETDDTGESCASDMMATALSKSATHGDVIDDYIRRNGDCKTYGSKLYVWKGESIWQNHSNGYIQKRLRTDYNHVGKCSKVADYKALSGAILNEESINVSRWDEAAGFPCSDGFWLVDTELREVRKVDYTKDLMCRFKMGIKPDFDMPTPMFNKIIENVENPILYQQLFGLTIAGYLNQLQKVFCMMGSGGAGKGTTSDIMAAMLPSGRLTSISIENLNDEKYRAAIADARVNFVAEVKSKFVDITGLKEFTGGGLITGRSLYNNPISFYSNCSFVISMNRFFKMPEFGDETLRRFGHSIVKFTKRHNKQIDNLSQIIIEEELPGVLAWAINGVRLFFEHGLDTELSVQQYDEWVNSADGFNNFIRDEIEFKASAKITPTAIWDKYKAYAESSRYTIEGRNEIYNKIEALPGVGSRVKIGGNHYFRGLQLLQR